MSLPQGRRQNGLDRGIASKKQSSASPLLSSRQRIREVARPALRTRQALVNILILIE